MRLARVPVPTISGTQERIVRGRMPTLELVNERFARYLRIGLFNYMHRSAEISVGSIRVQKYSEFTRNLVVPTNLNLVAAKPLRVRPCSSSTPAWSFWWSTTCSAAMAAFTRASKAGISPRPNNASFRDCWGSYSASTPAPGSRSTDLTFEYIRSEMNSQFANIATPSEIVIATTFSLEFGGSNADMHICFPYSMIEPIRDLLYSAMQSDQLSTDRRWIIMLRKQLINAEVEITARLATQTVSLREILTMKVGDVIPLEVPDKIVALVDDVPLMECRYGQQRGQYALKIDRFMASENAEAPLGESNG
jgi:flagellar motor switch protein FliM